MRTGMERIVEAVKDRGPCCVGLDTDLSYLPQREYAGKFLTPLDALRAYNFDLVDATLDVTAVYKVQIAYYEALGLAGLEVYRDTLSYIRKKGGIVIADIKRGDIQKTAECYAKAHFCGDFEADAITVSPYMGMDTLVPFLPYLEQGKALFSLLVTSNPGAADLEYEPLAGGKRLYEKLAHLLDELGRPYRGASGYSGLGAVVGCTHPREAAALRQQFPHLFFLIPGYGAQGGRGKDLIGCFDSFHNGGVVNSSRGILTAYQQKQYGGKHPIEAARAAVIRMRDDLMGKGE